MHERWKTIGLIIAVLSVVAIVFSLIYFVGDNLGWETKGEKIKVGLLAILFIMGVLISPMMATGVHHAYARLKAQRKMYHPQNLLNDANPQPDTVFTAIREYLRQRYGIFWPRKLRWLLVSGERADVEKILPGLTTQGWLANTEVLFLWGGSPENSLSEQQLKRLKTWRWRYPIDAQFWIVNAGDYLPTKTQKDRQNSLLRQMQTCNHRLGWAAPLYVIDVREQAGQPGREDRQPIGSLFPLTWQNESAVENLALLVQKITQPAMMQVMENHQQAFLLTLAHDLQQRDISRFVSWMSAFLKQPESNPLRGVFFTYPVQAIDDTFQMTSMHQPTWSAIARDCRTVKGYRVGRSWFCFGMRLMLVSTILLGAGCVVSYAGNVSLISSVAQLAKQSNDQTLSLTARLSNQYAFMQQLRQLQHRRNLRQPWYLRFGLNQNDRLLSLLWPAYRQADWHNMQRTLVEHLTKQLREYVQMPPGDPRRAILTKAHYDRLKTYLMMSQPDRADTVLLNDSLLIELAPTATNASENRWQTVGPELIRFYAEHVSQHPGWAIEPDQRLINDVRQILIGQMGLQNAETTLYQGILQRASRSYANVSLSQLLSGVESSRLFATQEELPGIFTRAAWESVIERDIDRATRQRKEEMDWVLSEGSNQLKSDISPDTLKQRLTDRYFSDFAMAWLNFLNSVNWQRAETLSGAIEQLTLMADSRQSPLIALMNVINYQAQTGQKERALTDTLMKTAQEIFHQRNRQIEAISMTDGLPVGPLDSSLGTLLRILPGAMPENGDALSLQRYLTRVTRVRLKLQQIVNAPDPHVMTQALAKTVFEGKTIDLTDTRDYGSLIAASLGEEWAGLTNSLFVQPLEQAWQAVLNPAAVSFNRAWQESIVQPWRQAFNGRYPFKPTDNDASVPELGRFLRPDSGMIERFITAQLGGVLQKQGDTWFIDPINAQGLTFNPQFLTALNQLSQLSGLLFANGDAGMTFELLPLPGRDVVKTELVVDGKKVIYFNQMAAWHAFHWPGDFYLSGAQLRWQTLDTGLRLYDNFQGRWAWIRLLEKATVTQLDSSRYQLVWRAEDGKTLNYILRTHAQSGPLALLALNEFVLPSQVFITSTEPTLTSMATATGLTLERLNHMSVDKTKSFDRNHQPSAITHAGHFLMH